jgi:hypothetical protein
MGVICTITWVGMARGRAVGVSVAVGVWEGICVGPGVGVLVKTGVSDFWDDGAVARSTWRGKQEVRRLAKASSSNHRSGNFNLFIFDSPAKGVDGISPN